MSLSVTQLSGHRGGATDVDVDNKVSSDIVVSCGGEDKSLRVWDLRSGRCVQAVANLPMDPARVTMKGDQIVLATNTAEYDDDEEALVRQLHSERIDTARLGRNNSSGGSGKTSDKSLRSEPSRRTAPVLLFDRRNLRAVQMLRDTSHQQVCVSECNDVRILGRHWFGGFDDQKVRRFVDGEETGILTAPTVVLACAPTSSRSVLFGGLDCSVTFGDFNEQRVIPIVDFAQMRAGASIVPPLVNDITYTSSGALVSLGDGRGVYLPESFISERVASTSDNGNISSDDGELRVLGDMSAGAVVSADFLPGQRAFTAHARDCGVAIWSLESDDGFIAAAKLSDEIESARTCGTAGIIAATMDDTYGVQYLQVRQ
ncbi:MAG: hypothetical protein MHM6MM_008116 [Cercozoa sp. M6MM]